jgi:hypothetical protein
MDVWEYSGNGGYWSTDLRFAICDLQLNRVFPVSFSRDEPAAAMVGAVVLGEKAPVAAVELLRLF